MQEVAQLSVGNSNLQLFTLSGSCRNLNLQWFTLTGSCRNLNLQWFTLSGSCRNSNLRLFTLSGSCRNSNLQLLTLSGSCHVTQNDIFIFSLRHQSLLHRCVRAFFRLSENLQSAISNYQATLNIKSHETVSNSEFYGKTLASSKGNSHHYLKLIVKKSCDFAKIIKGIIKEITTKTF